MNLTEFLDKIDETARIATRKDFCSMCSAVSATFRTETTCGSCSSLNRRRIEAHHARMNPPTTLALTAALRKCVEALELISGPSEWNCEIGEANQRAAAKIVLSSLSESFKEMK